MYIKRKYVFILLFTAVTHFNCTAGGEIEDYIWLNAGSNAGDQCAYAGYRRGLYGFALGYTNRGEFGKDDVSDSAAPTTDVTLLGKKSIEGVFGADFYSFSERKPKGGSLFLAGGVHYIENRKLSQSNINGDVFTESTEHRIQFTYSFGVQYYSFEPLFIQFDYHSLRKVELQLGIVFKL